MTVKKKNIKVHLVSVRTWCFLYSRNWKSIPNILSGKTIFFFKNVTLYILNFIPFITFSDKIWNLVGYIFFFFLPQRDNKMDFFSKITERLSVHWDEMNFSMLDFLTRFSEYSNFVIPSKMRLAIICLSFFLFLSFLFSFFQMYCTLKYLSINTGGHINVIIYIITYLREHVLLY